MLRTIAWAVIFAALLFLLYMIWPIFHALPGK